jgi:4-aminobutyrate aminotransferase-like enzyme
LSTPGNATEARGLLGKKLAEVTPGNLKKTFFALGGSEANENAIKIARFYTGGTRFWRAIAPITARRTVRLP